MPTFSPVSQSRRNVAMNIRRGIALLGILFMNIPDYYSEAFRSNPYITKFWTRAIVVIVFEGKMRAPYDQQWDPNVK